MSDYNPLLIDVWRAIKSNPKGVYNLAASLSATPDTYYDVRSAFNNSPTGTLLHAAQFIYLNRHCFNGVYRTNRQGHYNVPKGINTGTLPSVDEFVKCARQLAKAELQCCDFEVACAQATPGDLVYLDPPYSRARRYSGEYGYDSFQESDECRLLQCLNRLSQNGTYAILSYSGNEKFIAQLSSNWQVDRISIPRKVAASHKNRTTAIEVLATNYQCGQHHA